MTRYRQEQQKQIDQVKTQIQDAEAVLKSIEDTIASGTDVERNMSFRRQFVDRLEECQRKKAWLESGEFLMSEQLRETFFAEDEDMLIRPMREEDQEAYIRVKKDQYEWDDESIYTEIWIAEKTKTIFPCVIIYKPDNQVVGYLSVNDLSKDLWEFVISVRADYRNKGIGTRALKYFSKSLSAYTGRKEFQCKVDAGNKASQTLMNKIEAECIGICKYLTLYGYENVDMSEEKKNISLHVRKVAMRLNVSPEDLILNVLDYRIHI